MAEFGFTAADFERLLKQFYKKEIGDIEAAAGLVIKAAADKHVARQKADAKAAFALSDKPGSRSFAEAFKAYHLKPRAELGFASISRAGPKHMWVFEEPGRPIESTRLMLVPTPDGRKLNVPRLGKLRSRKISFSQFLQVLFARFGKGNVAPLVTRDGRPRGIKVRLDRKSEWIVAYVLLPRVKMPSVLQFFATAEAIGREVPGKIQELLAGR